MSANEPNKNEMKTESVQMFRFTYKIKKSANELFLCRNNDISNTISNLDNLYVKNADRTRTQIS